MLPSGKYVVEVVVPPGYELVKEEDKNILIGDSFIAPVTVQLPNLGTAVYIIPDQAAVGSTYNANSTQNPTQSLGRAQTLRSHEGDTATMDTFWPCVGQTRIVPNFISLFPQSKEVAPPSTLYPLPSTLYSLPSRSTLYSLPSTLYPLPSLTWLLLKFSSLKILP